MKVTVCSRDDIEIIMTAGKFPQNTAVISFYDPAIKRIDEDYSHVDYSGVCNTVFYSELDDLDLDVLRRRGYTYDTYFPEVDDIAAFIYRAYENGTDIICQCEYGQSRSAACAAAILEFFCHNGISIFQTITITQIRLCITRYMMRSKSKSITTITNIFSLLMQLS